MDFKYPFYIAHADPAGVAQALEFFKEFYSRYPTGAEVGEALHQIRRELGYVAAPDTTPKRTRKKIEESE